MQKNFFYHKFNLNYPLSCFMSTILFYCIFIFFLVNFAYSDAFLPFFLLFFVIFSKFPHLNFVYIFLFDCLLFFLFITSWIAFIFSLKPFWQIVLSFFTSFLMSIIILFYLLLIHSLFHFLLLSKNRIN